MVNREIESIIQLKLVFWVGAGLSVAAQDVACFAMSHPR